MARRLRQMEAGGYYHVYNRAALQRPLFTTPGDWPLFLGALRDALARHPVGLFAWCLMPNHWHLLLQPADAAALPACVRWLTLAHSHRFQALHGRIGQGTLYRGRFGSRAVTDDAHLLTVVRHIERNPVRAGLVPRALDWPWSSVRERLAGSSRLVPLAGATAGRLACLARSSGDPGGAGSGETKPTPIVVNSR